MHSTLKLLPAIAAIFSTPALGAPSGLEARQEDWDGTQTGGIFCEGRLLPNWGDCDTIIDGNGYFETEGFEVCLNTRACRVWTQGNCRVSLCNNEQHEVCDMAPTWGSRVRRIEQECKPLDAGGYQSPPEPEEWTEVAIRLNTDWRVFAIDNQLVYSEMSVEQNKAELKAALEAQGEPHAVAKRSQENKLQARADRFYDTVTAYNVYRPGSAVFVVQVPNSGSYTVTKSVSTTLSVTASVGLSASAWDAIGASVGIDVGYSETVSNSVSVTINIDCGDDQKGQVYWRPFFDRYEGTLESTGERVTVWYPQTDSASRMNYDYQCTG